MSAFNVDEGFANNDLAPDPTTNAGEVLKAALIAKGITVDGVTYAETPKSIKDSGVVVASDKSPTLETLVSDMLKTSDNVYAEELLASAVYAKYGIVDQNNRKDYVLETLKNLGIDTRDYVFVNASGYSRDSKVTCDFENKLKEIMLSKGIDLGDMSSVSATDGTLTKRFNEIKGKLEAKTGTLDNVTALSGNLRNKISFTFISNAQFSDEEGRKYQENVVNSLYQFPYINNLTFPS
ncbi:MAG: D-alanyl-D-alanine carboxypeptidase [Acidimicrobiia bacterium]